MISSTLKTMIVANLNRSMNKPINPTYLTYTPTWRCNSRCMMCSVWKKTSKDELTLKDISHIFNDKKLKKIQILRISGGEPFMKENLTDIVKTIHSKTKFKLLHLTTNGTLTDRIINFIGNTPGIKIDLKISVDAVGKLHDKIRGINCFEKIIATLENISKLKRKLYNVALAQTITKLNIDEIKNVRELAEKYGFGHTVTVALLERPLWTGKGTPKFKTFNNFTNIEKKRIIDQLEISKFNPFIEKLVWKYSFKGLKNRLFYNKNVPNPRCMSLFSNIRIEPNGDLVICSYYPESIGNLKEKTFSKIWNSNLVKKKREFVKKCKGCWLNCETIPNAIYSGDLISETLLDFISHD